MIIYKTRLRYFKLKLTKIRNGSLAQRRTPAYTDNYNTRKTLARFNCLKVRLRLLTDYNILDNNQMKATATTTGWLMGVLVLVFVLKSQIHNC